MPIDCDVPLRAPGMPAYCDVPHSSPGMPAHCDVPHRAPGMVGDCGGGLYVALALLEACGVPYVALLDMSADCDDPHLVKWLHMCEERHISVYIQIWWIINVRQIQVILMTS